MRRERFVISDRSWQLLEPLLPGSSRSHQISGHGTLRSGGFAVGRKPMFFNVFSMRFLARPTLNTSLLTARSSALTDRRAAQKGGSQSSDRALKRRADDQGAGADGRARQSGALCAASRSAQRNYRRAGPDRGADLQSLDGPLSWFASKPLPGNGQSV